MQTMKLLVLLCFLPAILPAQQTKQFILGNWKSNRELTVPTIRLKKEISSELRARLEDLFGRMSVTYTEKEMTAFTPAHGQWPDWRFTSAYRIVIATDTKLVIVGQNPETQKDETTTVTFEGPNRYWISLEKIEGREYFDKVQPEESKEGPGK